MAGRLRMLMHVYADALARVASPHSGLLVRLHHHQPINVPTAGAQAFLMDYPQGERAINHHAGPERIGGC
jgi:hypothetical protein